MKKIFKAIYRKKLLFWSLIIVLVFVGLSIAKGGNQPTAELITVATGDITETVVATGTVRPKNAATLRFETAGTISKLYVEVGDKVVTGQLLATLNAGDLRQRVIQADAELQAAQIALQNASQGVDDTGVKNEQALATAYSEALAGLGEILNLVQTTNDTVRSVYDNASLNAKTEPLEKLDDAYDAIMFALKKLTPLSTRSEIETALQAAYAPLISMQQVSITLIKALTSLSSSAENDAYRLSASTAQADINNAVAQVAAYSKAIVDARTNSGLTVNTSSASYRNAQAAVATAQATVAVARAGLSNASLYAPMSGVIASKSKSIGESVVPADQVYYILGEGGLEITANIPEIDIAKIALGNKAQVTLDAYGDETVFEVLVALIDPAETVIDGVATYKVTFRFAAEDARIRSGMTANIVVSTQKREGVVVIPQRAIHVVNGKRMVTVLSGELNEEREVKTGLRGNDGNVELLSGVKAGEVLVIEKR